MKEIWKDIKGYEGLYKVSNLGKVYSIAYKKCLSPRSDRGYLCILLHKSGNKKYFLIHRLVAEAFIPNPNNYPQVNHKDEDKQNNHVSNLEWCTRKYNMNYGTRNKRARNSLKWKFTKVICITTGEEFDCISAASTKYNVMRANIRACCKNKIKSAGKHPVTGEKLVWKYIEE